MPPAKSTPPAPFFPYRAVPAIAPEPYVQPGFRSEDIAFRASLAAGAGTNPDKAARQQRDARSLGFPSQAAGGWGDTLSYAAMMKRIGVDTAQTPILRKHYEAPDVSILAKDDSGPLAGIEKSYGGASLASLYHRFAAGAYSLADKLVEQHILPGIPERQMKGRFGTSAGRLQNAYDLLPQTWAARGRQRAAMAADVDEAQAKEAAQYSVVGSALSQIPSWEEATKVDPNAPKMTAWDHAMLVPRSIASALPAMSSGLDALLGTAINLPGRNVVGDWLLEGTRNDREMAKRWAGPANTWLERQIQGGAQSIGYMLPGVAAEILTDGAATPLVAAAYLLPGAVGQGGESTLNALDAGLSDGDALRYGLTDAAIEAGFSMLPVGKFLGDVEHGAGLGKIFLHQVYTEVPGEALTTVAQNYNAWKTLNPEKTDAEFWGEQPAAVRDTIAQTVLMLGATTAMGKGMQMASGRHTRSGGGVAEAASGLTLHDGPPAAFDDFAAAAADGGPVKDVYVKPDALRAVAQTPEGQQAIERTPGVAEQLAADPAKDVHVSAADFAAHLAEPAIYDTLSGHIKTAPDGVTHAEALEASTQKVAALREGFDRAIAGKADNAAFQASRQKVVDDIRGQLDTANRFKPDTNKAYADFTGHWYAAQSARLGILPEELHAQHPLKIDAGLDPVMAPGYDQGVADTFKATIGKVFQGVVTHGVVPIVTQRLPTVLRMLGLAEKPITIGQSVLRKVAGAKHDIDRATLEQLPKLIQAPVAILDSSADDSLLSVLVVTPEGKPMVAVIGRGAEGERSHYISSVYTKDAPGWFEQQVKQGRLRYVDAKRASALADISSLQLRGWNQGEAQGKKIITLDDLVKEVDRGRGQSSDGRPNAATTDAIREGMTADPNARSDGSALKIIDTATLFKQGPRGTYSPGKSTISLNANADFSTFLHEMGHHMLEVTADIASGPDAPVELRQDMDALLDWFGIGGNDGHKAALDTWNAMSLNEKRPYHEQFARGFELYLREGKAPSKGLVRLFERFRKWLEKVYLHADELNVDLSDDVRQVMDRLLTTPGKRARREAATRTVASRIKAQLDASEPAAASAEPVTTPAGLNVRNDGIAAKVANTTGKLNPHSLPKAGGEAFEQSVIDRVKAGIRSALAAARGDHSRTTQVEVAPVQAWLTDEARASGLDLEGFRHIVDTSAIRHIEKRHGDARTEAAHGQVAVSDSDFELIPEVLSTPDHVILGLKNNRHQDIIGYVKTFADGKTVYLEEVRTGRRTLAAQSMWKYPARANAKTIASSLVPIVRNGGGDTSAVRIVDTASKFNPATDSTPGANGREAQVFADAAAQVYTALSPELGLTPEGMQARYPLRLGAEAVNKKGSDVTREIARGSEPSSAADDGTPDQTLADNDETFQQSPVGRATPKRKAATLDEAREAVKPLLGKPLKNDATGLEATVSRRTLDKMASEKAHKKSSSAQDHALAIANIDHLFANAVLNNSYDDIRGEPTIKRIHRFVAPLITPDGVRAVKMTVKETTHPDTPNPLYSIEAIDLVKSERPSHLSEISGHSDGTEHAPQSDFTDDTLTHIARADKPLEQSAGGNSSGKTEAAKPERGPGSAGLSADSDGTDHRPQSDFAAHTIAHLEAVNKQLRAMAAAEKSGARGPEGLGYHDPAALSRALDGTADVTTLVHEAGRLHLDILTDLATRPDAPPRIVADVRALLKSFDPRLTLEAWNRLGRGGQAPYVARFSHALEAYLSGSEMPPLSLRPLFAQVHDWLIASYRSLPALREGLLPAARSVMDRLAGAQDRTPRGPRLHPHAETAASAVSTLITTSHIDTLMGAAGASRLRGRSPEAFHAFVRDVARSGPLSDLYVHPEPLAKALQTPAGQKALAGAPDFAAQLAGRINDAHAAGQDVRIPLEDFATHLSDPEVHTGLADHLRTTPDALTRTEAIDALKTIDETPHTDDSRNSHSSHHALTQKIKADLDSTGHYPPHRTALMAEMYGRTLAAHAALNGKTPEGMHAFALHAPGKDHSPEPGVFHQIKTPQDVMNDDGTVTLHHWSLSGDLAASDPKMWGENIQALTREERNRIGVAPPRTYFGIGRGHEGGYKKEYSIGKHLYSTTLPIDRLYDYRADPLDVDGEAHALQDKNPGVDITSLKERLIRQKGYLGYWLKSDGRGTFAAVFDGLPLQYHGIDDGKTNEHALRQEPSGRPAAGRGLPDDDGLRAGTARLEGTAGSETGLRYLRERGSLRPGAVPVDAHAGPETAGRGLPHGRGIQPGAAGVDQPAHQEAEFRRLSDAGILRSGPWQLENPAGFPAEGRDLHDARSLSSGPVRLDGSSGRLGQNQEERQSRHLEADTRALADVIEAEGGDVTKTLPLGALGRSRDVPVTTLAALEGKTVTLTTADRTAAVLYTGVDAAQVDPAFPLPGGIFAALDPRYQPHRIAWIVRGKGVATAMINKAKAGADHMLILLGSEDMHRSNVSVSTAYFRTLDAYRRDGRISDNAADRLAQMIRSARPGDAMLARHLQAFPGFGDPQALAGYLDTLSFPARRRILDILDSQAARRLGAPPLPRVLDETRDSLLTGHRQGDAVLVVRIDPDQPPLALAEAGLKAHPDYPYAIHGEVIGRLDPPVHRDAIWADALDARRAEAAAAGKPTTGPVFDRAFALDMPAVTLTPELLARIGDVSRGGIETANQVQVVADAINGRWRTSRTAVKGGGVSAADFVRAIHNSPAHTSLPHYSVAELKQGIKAGRIELFQLGKAQIFFMLSEGPDGGKTLSAAVKNEPGVRGVAGEAIMIKAIEAGATHLDAYVVKSNKYPEGFLPRLFAKFGFVQTDAHDFDRNRFRGDLTEAEKAHAVADLHHFWSRRAPDHRAAIHGNAQHVDMKWSGLNDQRASALRSYLRSDPADLSAGRTLRDAPAYEEQPGEGYRATPATGRSAADAGRTESDQTQTSDVGLDNHSRTSQLSDVWRSAGADDLVARRREGGDEGQYAGGIPEHVETMPPGLSLPGRAASASLWDWSDDRGTRRDQTTGGGNPYGSEERGIPGQEVRTPGRGARHIHLDGRYPRGSGEDVHAERTGRDVDVSVSDPRESDRVEAGGGHAADLGRAAGDPGADSGLRSRTGQGDHDRGYPAGGAQGLPGGPSRPAVAGFEADAGRHDLRPAGGEERPADVGRDVRYSRGADTAAAAGRSRHDPAAGSAELGTDGQSDFASGLEGIQPGRAEATDVGSADGPGRLDFRIAQPGRGEPRHDAEGHSRHNTEAGLGRLRADSRTIAGLPATSTRNMGLSEADHAAMREVFDRASDPDDVFNQDARGARRGVSPQDLAIRLQPDADLPAALLELGRFRLRLLMQQAALPDAPAWVVADARAILREFGEDSGQFSRAYERYLFGNEAASPDVRHAFQHFSQWLSDVHKTVPGLRVQLSDEANSVLDRMVAAQTEIAAAQTRRGLDLPLEAPKGVDMAAWSRTHDLAEDASQAAQAALLARSLRDMQWLDGARSPQLRRLQNRVSGLRNKIRAEVEAEVAAEPVNRARAYLHDGGHRLDLETARSMVPEGAHKRLDGMTGKDGLPPDIAASLVGYDSGEALVRALVSEPSLSDKIRILTTQRLLAEHGDLIDAERVARAADEAVFNDARIEALAVAISAADPKGDETPALIATTRGLAQQTIDGEALRHLRPELYAAASARAGKAAAAALKAGDTAKAVTELRKQLYNVQAAKLAFAAQGEIKDAESLFAEVAAGPATNDMAAMAQGLLAEFGYGVHDDSEKSELSRLEESDPQGYTDIEAFVSQAVSAAPKSGDSRDISFADFRNLHDAVSRIVALVRRSQSMRIGDKLVPLPDAARDVADGLKTDLPPLRALSLLDSNAIQAHLGRWAKAQDPALHRALFQPLADAGVAFQRLSTTYAKRLRDVARSLDLKTGRIDAPELGYTFGGANGGNGMAELVGALRHTGNASGLQKLFAGRNWADGWSAFITRMHAEKRLTKAHWDYVQAEWDLYAELTPQLQAAHTAVYGAPFNAAPAQAVATPFGVYKGGFVAAVIDPRLADDTLIRQMAEDRLGGTTGAFLVPSQMSGLDTVHAAVLALDLGLAQHGLDKALRFATLAEPMRDLMRLLRSHALHGKLPEETLHSWINSSAHVLPAEDASGRMTGGAMDAVRRNPILSALFSQMKDSLGTWNDTANLGKDRLTDAALRLMRSPEALAREIAETSPYMAERLKDYMAEMRDAGRQALADKAPWSKGHEAFLAAGQRYAFDLTAWTAAYSKAVESGAADPVAQADAVVAGLAPKASVDTSLGALLTSFAAYCPKNRNVEIASHPANSQTLYWLGTLSPALSAARLPDTSSLRPWLPANGRTTLPHPPPLQTRAMGAKVPEPRSPKGIHDPARLASALTGIPEATALADGLNTSDTSNTPFPAKSGQHEGEHDFAFEAFAQQIDDTSLDSSLPGKDSAKATDIATSSNVSDRRKLAGHTPSKYSRTGREVLERMRKEGLIQGDGPLVSGNPHNLKVLGPDKVWYNIDHTVDMAHNVDAVAWWNEKGRFKGARAPEVRQFMLDSKNYRLEPQSFNRSAGGKVRQTYLPPDLSNFDVTE